MPQKPCGDLMFGGLLDDDAACELPVGHEGPHQATVMVPDILSGRSSEGISLGEAQPRIAEWGTDGCPWFIDAAKEES